MQSTFEIEHRDDGSVAFSGRFDASHEKLARHVLDQLSGSCVVDFGELKYISSAGLGLLFATQRRLLEAGEGLRLVNLNPHIREIFTIAGFDNIFEID